MCSAGGYLWGAEVLAPSGAAVACSYKSPDMGAGNKFMFSARAVHVPAVNPDRPDLTTDPDLF